MDIIENIENDNNENVYNFDTRGNSKSFTTENTLNGFKIENTFNGTISSSHGSPQHMEDENSKHITESNTLNVYNIEDISNGKIVPSNCTPQNVQNQNSLMLTGSVGTLEKEEKWNTCKSKDGRNNLNEFPRDIHPVSPPRSKLDLQNNVENFINIEESALLLTESIEKSALFSIKDIINNLGKQKEEECKKLIDYISRLEEEKDELIIKGSHDVCLSQIEQQNRELLICKQEHELDLRTINNLKFELEAMRKKYEIANKEKEATVMRYAKGEMEVIKLKQELEGTDKKHKESIKERDLLATKLKSLSGEKNRICQMIDSKCSELAAVQKEVEKLKDENNTKDIKIKWIQNKLHSETESQKESEINVQKLHLKLQEALNEVEKSKKESQLNMKRFCESQENRAFVLDQQVKELQAQIILERHCSEDKDSTIKQLQHEIETLKSKHQLFIDENSALLLKVQSLEKEKANYECLSQALKETTEKQSESVVELHSKLQELEMLRSTLKQNQQKLVASQDEVCKIKARNLDLEQDIASCKEREADMLEFTQKVTTKNVRLQSEFSLIEKKAHQLEYAEEPLIRRVSELEKKIKNLEKERAKEKNDGIEERKVVARHLAEKTAKVEQLIAHIEDLKGEFQVTKHKQAATIRELNRELQQYRKKVDQYDPSNENNLLNQNSRTSSCASLNEHLSTNTLNNQLGLDRQSLVDKIVKLQRKNAKFSEKIDFLEEHAQQLVSELQKKTRVLQNYILREEAGALSSSFMDNHKAEFAKHGGIMATMYGSKTVDENMTLELSLEINRKLQAVLEDTLLKNITLKENIDTLGDEITRLSQKINNS